MAPRSTRKAQVVSLFAGAGGFDIALERAGWDVVTATDYAADAMDTLRASKAAGIPIKGRRGKHLAKTTLIEKDVATLTADELAHAPPVPIGVPTCWPAGHRASPGRRRVTRRA